MTPRSRALGAALLILATQALLLGLSWRSWAALRSDEMRAAGKALAGVAGAVCALAALMFFAPLAASVSRVRQRKPARRGGG